MDTATLNGDKVLYTANVHTTGGRDGQARSSDGRLDIKLTPPGAVGAGTNPEQLFGAGWSACFIGAMQHNAAARKVALPKDTAVDAQIELLMGEAGFRLRARLAVSLPGVDPEAAREIIEAAHETCPYSKATRGNIDVTLDLV